MKNQQYKQNTKSNNNKIFANNKTFAIALLMWLFALALCFAVVLWNNENECDFSSVDAGATKYFYLLIDLNLNDKSAEDIISSISADCDYKLALFGGDGANASATGSFTKLDSALYNGFQATIEHTDYILYLDFGYGISGDNASTVLVSANLTNVYNAFNVAGKPYNKLFKGFTLFYPTSSGTSNETTITVSDGSCIFQSTENMYLLPSWGSNGEDTCGGFILHAEWEYVKPTNADVTVNIAVQGANNSGVIVYLQKDGVMLAQLAQASNGSIVIKNLNIGETYELLISKPYMWSITATGSGELSGCKYTITVGDPTNDANINVITLSFSGGGTSNNVIIL